MCMLWFKKKKVSYIKNVCVQLISEVRGGFHFQMTDYSRLGGKKAQLVLLHQKKPLLGLWLFIRKSMLN